VSELLLEIGTEEIPDWMIPAALADFERRFAEAIKKFELGDGVSTSTEATARRLVLFANGLPSGQADREETLTGPPKSVAFDAEGNPTKAGEGFARKAGVAFADLQIDDKGKLFVSRTVTGRSTADVLSEVLPRIILSITFPKQMYWAGKSGPRFIRPIRWLVCLLDGQVVPFEIAGVASGDTTCGHRRLGGNRLTVTGADDYRHKLASNHVILSASERTAKITAEAEALLPEGRRIRSNPKLLSTLTYLTEYPTAILGSFDESYLSLPDEVLETVMLVHQKYFAIEDESGKLSNAFVAVANLNGDPDGEIRRGNERVLRARFNDAQFFWDFDQKKALTDRVDDLKVVTFQAELGSYFDKSASNREAAKQLAEALGFDSESARSADRASELAKCDLTTEMVGEFPELQGQMGGLYAADEGESSAVADAIYDHYLPAGAGDALPRGDVGRVVSLADKLTTLGGMFGLGMIPTGSRDPLALRRAAYGVIRIVVEGELPLSLDQLVQVAGAGENAGKLREFFVERLRYWLREVGGFAYDEINAVMAASDEAPGDVVARAKAIATVRPTPNFEPLAVSFKRIGNILEKAGGGQRYAGAAVNQDLLEAGAEADLFAAFDSVVKKISEMKREAGFESALLSIASLRPAVDKFFDDVLVMAEDEAVRSNRLTFLARMLVELSTIADFAEIVSE
jgi:glycyl-tRNA synthetase beta chain